MSMIYSAKRIVKKIVSYLVLPRIYRKYSEYTMVPKKDYFNSLDLVSKYKKVDGCIIECGVWRGGMIAGMADVLGANREYYLFDSFEGLPDAKEIDGEGALAWQADKESSNYHDNCTAEIEWAQKAMNKSKATNVTFLKGWFEDTIPQFQLKEPIAVLRLDGDWYDSTMVCLEHLFPLVIPGGLIILDDYYAWDGCSKALHDYLSKHKRSERIKQAYTSGCFLIKNNS